LDQPNFLTWRNWHAMGGQKELANFGGRGGKRSQMPRRTGEIYSYIEIQTWSGTEKTEGKTHPIKKTVSVQDDRRLPSNVEGEEDLGGIGVQATIWGVDGIDWGKGLK